MPDRVLTRRFTGTNSITTSSGGFPANSRATRPCARSITFVADIREEAAKAKAIGCQALYLDPGWDTLFGSKIWDESRMGTCKYFAEMLRSDYGLKLSLHTPLTGWCDPTAYPTEMYRMDRFGQRLTWERSARLRRLAAVRSFPPVRRRNRPAAEGAGSRRGNVLHV